MNPKPPGIVLLASIVLFSAGVAAGLAEEGNSAPTSRPTTAPATQAATQKQLATPAPTLDVLLNRMPKNIWPDPKGNPIREEANKDSRDRWIQEHVLNQQVKLTGFVGKISREQAIIVLCVNTQQAEVMGTTSISNGDFAIEVKGRCDDAITMWGKKQGLTTAVCVPKLLANSEKVSIEPLLALKLSQRVTVTGAIDQISVGPAGGFAGLTLSGCQFK